MKKEDSTVDVLAYFLNPPMKVLSEAEKKKILEKYGINTTQLPMFSSSDPVVLALKAKSGDMIRIERDDGTGKYVAYRIVG